MKRLENKGTGKHSFTSMQLRCYGLVVIMLFALVITSCKREDRKDNADNFGNVTESEQSSESVLCDDFNCLEDGVYQIAIPESNQVAYITTTKATIDSMDPGSNKLFRLTNKNGKWVEPQEISFQTKGKLCGAVVSIDGKTLFLSYKEEGRSSYDIGTVDIAMIKDNTITDITYIDKLNTDFDEMIGAIDKNGTIYYNSISEQNNVNDYFIGKYDGTNYSKLRLGNEINRPSFIQSMGIFGITVNPVGDQLIYTSATSELLGASSYNLYTIRNEGDGFKNAILLDEKINSYDTDIIRCYISGDGKTLYYCKEEAFLVTEDLKSIQPKWYKIPLSTVLQDNTQGMATYDSAQYESADFPLELRSKGEESEKQGIYYEIFVRAFADSNGDGIGDFNGITSKLDYLQELGVTGIWLMPINKSFSYHGYDVVDYYSLNEDYGTEEDLKNLLEEAHKHGIKVIMDLVVNHTAIANPWFLEGLSGFDSKYKDYYRIVSKKDSSIYNAEDTSPWRSKVWNGLETSDYAYYAIFTETMPDLNYNNPEVRAEIKKIAKKWLDLGMDGYRLDAAMHIYGDNEFKKQNDQLQHNIQWWNEFAKACEEVKPDVYLVGEAWQDEEVLPEYVQPFDTKFNFAFTQAMMNGIKSDSAMYTEDQNLSQYLQSILEQYATYDTKYLDGVFASNHDQDRVMSQLGDVNKAKLAGSIYMTLEGNPFIYYGEEIGMVGSGNDEYKRTAFKWNESGSKPTANWLKTMWNQEDTTNNATVSVEEQIKDSESMYQFYKELIKVRKANNALTQGKFIAYDSKDSQIMAYERISDTQSVIVIHNFSPDRKEINVQDLSLGKVVFSSQKENKTSQNKVQLDGYGSIIIEFEKVK